jgi:quinol monooxygenase YgiN
MMKFDDARAEAIYWARRSVMRTADGCEVFEVYPPGLHDRQEPMMNPGIWGLMVEQWRSKKAARHERNRKEI